MYNRFMSKVAVILLALSIPFLLWAKEEFILRKDLKNGFTFEQWNTWWFIAYRNEKIYNLNFEDQSIVTQEDIESPYNHYFNNTSPRCPLYDDEKLDNRWQQWMMLTSEQKTRCISESHYNDIKVDKISSWSIFAIYDPFILKLYDTETKKLFSSPWGIYVKEIKKWKHGMYFLMFDNTSACYNSLYFLPKGSSKYKLLFSSLAYCDASNGQYYLRIEKFTLGINKVIVTYLKGNAEDSLKKYYKTIYIK